LPVSSPVVVSGAPESFASDVEDTSDVASRWFSDSEGASPKQPARPTANTKKEHANVARALGERAPASRDMAPAPRNVRGVAARRQT
jgi:hypothetical protein